MRIVKPAHKETFAKLGSHPESGHGSGFTCVLWEAVGGDALSF